MDDAVTTQARAACDEIAAVFQHIDGTATYGLLDEIVNARRIALYGVGREGLMMKALAMRLFHLGLDAHPVGTMTTPPIGPGDLMLVSAGPGMFATVIALLDVAHTANARTAMVTAQPTKSAERHVDTVVRLPAQTMVNDTGAAANRVLPMGSAFEGAEYVFFEILVLHLRNRLGISTEVMRARHTNLE